MWVLWFNIFLCLVLAVWFVKRQYSKPYFWLIVASFLCKVLATIAFVHLHQKLYPQYTPDYQLIFADACKLSNFIYQSILDYFKILYDAPLDTESWYLASQPRAFFAAKLYSLLAWLTGQNFWLTMLYASLIAFACIWWLARTLMRFFPHTRSAVLLSFIFLPSLAFWASATTKETLLISYLAILSVIFLKFIYKKIVWWEIVIFGVLVYWLVLLKYYYAFSFLFSLTLYFVLTLAKKLRLYAKFTLFGALGLVILCLSFLHPNLQLNNFVEALYNNYILILEASPDSSAVNLALQPTWQSLLLRSPIGLWLGLFAPLPHQVSKWQILPFALENMCILFLVAYILFLATKRKIIFYEKETHLLVSLLVFIAVMATFLGLSSPNFGALSRYRIGFSPFLVYALLAVFQYLKRQAP